MPKKFPTTNSKAVEARARKEAIRVNDKTRKEAEAEDAMWRDDDKSMARKLARKDDKEKKKQETLERKEANKSAYEEEMSTIKSAKPTTKVTRADIEQLGMQQNTEMKSVKVVDKPLEENINRLVVDGDEARSVEDAIAVLTLNPDKNLDRHPERRMKAAYDAFEATQLPQLKSENPNLRLSQLKQMLKKDWLKSPDNPLNQRSLAYNSKT